MLSILYQNDSSEQVPPLPVYYSHIACMMKSSTSKFTQLNPPFLTLLLNSDDLSAATTPSVLLKPIPRDLSPSLTVKEVSSLARPFCPGEIGEDCSRGI